MTSGRNAVDGSTNERRLVNQKVLISNLYAKTLFKLLSYAIRTFIPWPYTRNLCNWVHTSTYTLNGEVFNFLLARRSTSTKVESKRRLRIKYH